MPNIRRMRAGSVACRLGFITIGLSALMHGAMAQEAQIRKALAARLPQFAVVDEVMRTPIPGCTKYVPGHRCSIRIAMATT